MFMFMPGQRVSVRRAQHPSLQPARLLEVGASELTLKLDEEVELKPGDALRLEMAQQQDALYVVDARVKETGTGGICPLALRGEPKPWQQIATMPQFNKEIGYISSEDTTVSPVILLLREAQFTGPEVKNLDLVMRQKTFAL